ncbi:TRAP transporter large permease [Rhodovulum sulfidophilum]|uniref:TRAP transporter large permease protein n=1 Tax=Rhodovulum sulfidophilum TaxID=35806 RepID=A0ABS1RRJ2_RHOSU|nr:TRAP transporter large permease [Rhodovulum sulfidophilum]MBL3608686.1 TRAP transporter large permease [Rhodovulum sulfidophilum]
MTSLLVVIGLLGLLLLGVPVGFALAFTGLVGLMTIVGFDSALSVLSTTPLSTTNGFELIAVPLFILMAEFVIVSGIADRMFKAITIWVGRLPGGLAVATALAGAGFGAISGSSTAAAAALSSTSIPAMRRAGYDVKFASGVVAVSGTLAMLIPPSIALVLYGIIVEVNIASLLIGGVIPGIIVTLAIIATIYVLMARDPSIAPAARPWPMRDKLRALRAIGPMLLLLLCVTGSIYLGIATPTEAAGLGAFGAFLIAAAFRTLTLKTTWGALARAVRATCMIFMIIIGAHIFGYVLTLGQITPDFVNWITGLEVSPYLVMAGIIAFYLVMGCFMDQMAILILTVPVMVPAITSLGFDPVWFGVLVVVAAEVGMIPPPLGMNIFVVSRYAERPLSEIFRGVAPHVVSHIIVLALLVAFPQLVLWLPGTTQ